MKLGGSRSTASALAAWAAVSAIAASAGCRRETTEIVLVVETTLAVPEQIDAIDVVIDPPSGGTPTMLHAPLVGEGALTLPLTLGLGAGGERLEPVGVTATAMAHGVPIVSRRVRTAFVRGASRMLRVVLLGSCASRMCEQGSTCGETGCASERIAPETLPEWTGSVPPRDPQPTLPVRAAVYHASYPEDWASAGPSGPRAHPSAGIYRTDAVIADHIRAMQYGHVAVGIVAWDGPGSLTDSRMPALLAAAAATDFRWAVYYEPEHASTPPAPEQLRADLAALRTGIGTDRSFFRIDGRPVVFARNQGTDVCQDAARWRTASEGGLYVVLKVGAGFDKCAAQPDGWHQYAPADAASPVPGYSFAISPGYWGANDGSPRLARDLTRWQQNVREMAASGAPFQLVTSFNDWSEFSPVESAQEWATASGFGAYLDALHAVEPAGP